MNTGKVPMKRMDGVLPNLRPWQDQDIDDDVLAISPRADFPAVAPSSVSKSTVWHLLCWRQTGRDKTRKVKGLDLTRRQNRSEDQAQKV